MTLKLKRMRLPGALLLVALLSMSAIAQQVQPSPFDFGKMWTFENPPIEWFNEAYDFDVDQAWFDDVRKSSLRFASWCSASFVSPDGLIMTNHHCAVPALADVEKEGEDLFKTGFYANSRSDERRAEGLFVEQLIQVADISDRVDAAAANAENEAARGQKIQEAIGELQQEYSENPEWAGLRIQVVGYYSGVKFSLYGYKRYDDIRLVFLPEEQLGFFGGDPDNFTYPRYNLDCSFWRAYDENGNPVNSSENFFQFNDDGVQENTPVFIVGNPGSTERYRTVSQLEYDRDYRFPVQLRFLKDRLKMMEKEYEKNPDTELKSNMLSFSNSIKAFEGIVGGLNDSRLFARKVAMEQKIRSQAESQEHWNLLTDHYSNLSRHVAELSFLGPNPDMMGYTIVLAHALNELKSMMDNNASEAEMESAINGVKETAAELGSDDELAKLTMVLSEMNDFAGPEDTYMKEILEGRTPAKAAMEILSETLFRDADKLDKLLDKKPEKLFKKKDPILEMAELMVSAYQDAVMAFQSTGQERNHLEEKVMQSVFDVYGTSLPPDATFTLRISDGRVKGYEYNGTVAPYKTTFFGLYDRYYSHNKTFPWSLPEKWENPPLEFLKIPFNFINTCDIIGGNSGSAIINMNKEAVGLVFDGNIESLPGNFIFDEVSNRSVGVHAGGMVGALKYIYKADRLIEELNAK